MSNRCRTRQGVFCQNAASIWAFTTRTKQRTMIGHRASRTTGSVRIRRTFSGGCPEAANIRSGCAGDPCTAPT